VLVPAYAGLNVSSYRFVAILLGGYLIGYGVENMRRLSKEKKSNRKRG
jgi:hypothetical protein